MKKTKKAKKPQQQEQSQKPQDIFRNLAGQVDKHMKEVAILLEKNHLASRIVIVFPKKRTTPIFSRIAMWVIKKQGGIMDTEFRSIKKQ